MFQQVRGGIRGRLCRRRRGAARRPRTRLAATGGDQHHKPCPVGYSQVPVHRPEQRQEARRGRRPRLADHADSRRCRRRGDSARRRRLHNVVRGSRTDHAPRMAGVRARHVRAATSTGAASRTCCSRSTIWCHDATSSTPRGRQRFPKALRSAFTFGIASALCPPTSKAGCTRCASGQMPCATTTASGGDATVRATRRQRGWWRPRRWRSRRLSADRGGFPCRSLWSVEALVPDCEAVSLGGIGSIVC